MDLAARYINTAENVLADALSRVVDEKKVCLKDECLEIWKKEGLIDTVISHERLENLGDNMSL